MKQDRKKCKDKKLYNNCYQAQRNAVGYTPPEEINSEDVEGLLDCQPRHVLFMDTLINCHYLGNICLLAPDANLIDHILLRIPKPTFIYHINVED